MPTSNALLISVSASTIRTTRSRPSPKSGAPVSLRVRSIPDGSKSAHGRRVPNIERWTEIRIYYRCLQENSRVDFVRDPRSEEFRTEVRNFLAEHLPADMAWRGQQGYLPDRDDSLRWTKILHD